MWCLSVGSNHWPLPCEGSALTTELERQGGVRPDAEQSSEPMTHTGRVGVDESRVYGGVSLADAADLVGLFSSDPIGGEEEIRTPGLPDANRSLFHLSYNPFGTLGSSRTTDISLIRAVLLPLSYESIDARIPTVLSKPCCIL